DSKPLSREPRIRGWSWFQPYHDYEKIALATDMGVLGVYGIRQIGNPEDPPLFQLLPDEIQVADGAEASTRPGRAQGRHHAEGKRAGEDNLGVLRRGRLRRLQLNPFRGSGDSLWENPPELGSPLHSSRLDEAGKTLFVVTQSLSSPGCRATAVRASDGRILWQ